MTNRYALCIVRHGRLRVMVDILADVTAEFEYADSMRHAMRATERDACDWPDLRRAILAYGGIGPSPDYDSVTWPGDLYRAKGQPPDMVAAEAVHAAPWGESGDDSAMLAYLQRSWSQWQRTQQTVEHRALKPVAPAKLKPGQRSFVELVAELKRKHGADVDLSGLREEYRRAYETGERVTVERDGRTYRGTVGATRGPRPRFVLLLSLDL